MPDGSGNAAPMQLVLDPGRVGRALLIVACLLTALHVLAMLCWYLDLIPIDEWLYYSFFDLDEEEGFGTWFSSLNLLWASLLTLLLARSAAARGHGRWWLLLGWGFLLLSLDEVVGFHEMVNTVVTFTHWTTFGAILVAVVGMAYLPFLWSLPPRTRWLLVLAGALFVAGSVGVERATVYHEHNDLLDTLGYHLTTAVEEFLEMAGVILYLYAVLDHIRITTGEVPVLSVSALVRNTD